MSNYVTSMDLQQGHKNERFYCYSVVTYATLDELRPLLTWAKEWAYIYHDKDKTDKHYHALIAFEDEKSYRQILRAVKSEQNTFVQGLKRAVGNMFDYFTHDTDQATKDEKEKYSIDDIVYSSEEYWRARLQWHSDKTEKANNESFHDDLLDPNMSICDMGRKYGRDFMKNVERYWTYRNWCLDERRNNLYLEMDGIPEDICEETGEAKTMHTVLSVSEYQLLQELRFHKYSQISKEQENEARDKIIRIT